MSEQLSRIKAAADPGVDFYEFTGQFRHAFLQQQVFYERDGHCNRAGHAFFADNPAPLIKDSLNTGGAR